MLQVDCGAPASSASSRDYGRLELSALAHFLRQRFSARDQIEQQVAEAAEALQRASQLTTNLQNMIQERWKSLSKLKDDLGRYDHLASIEKEKAAPLLAEIELIFQRRTARERWISFAINLAAGFIIFAMGVLLSGPIKLLAAGKAFVGP